MRSEKQIAASRLNGAKSRGPLTPATKLKSSANSYRHGRYSQNGSPEVNTLLLELTITLSETPAPNPIPVTNL
jgi:hypothetical protein